MHDEQILISTSKDFGSFDNNFEFASFAIWDDSENPELKAWELDFDFETVKFTEPTGIVFGGVVDFVESPIDFGLNYKVCLFQDGWEEARCAAVHHNMSMFTTEIIRADLIPEDGELFDAGSLFAQPEFGMPGIDNTFGQEFDPESEKWFIWMWNTETNYNWQGDNYDAYVFQTSSDGTDFMYSEKILIEVFSGASNLIAAASAAILLTWI